MVMAGVIPGQNTDASALANMEETPWWAACRLESSSGPCKLSCHLLYINHCETDDIRILRLGTCSWTQGGQL